MPRVPQFGDQTTQLQPISGVRDPGVKEQVNPLFDVAEKGIQALNDIQREESFVADRTVARSKLVDFYNASASIMVKAQKDFKLGNSLGASKYYNEEISKVSADITMDMNDRQKKIFEESSLEYNGKANQSLSKYISGEQTKYQKAEDLAYLNRLSENVANSSTTEEFLFNFNKTVLAIKEDAEKELGKEGSKAAISNGILETSSMVLNEKNANNKELLNGVLQNAEKFKNLNLMTGYDYETLVDKINPYLDRIEVNNVVDKVKNSPTVSEAKKEAEELLKGHPREKELVKSANSIISTNFKNQEEYYEENKLRIKSAILKRTREIIAFLEKERGLAEGSLKLTFDELLHISGSEDWINLPKKQQKEIYDTLYPKLVDTTGNFFKFMNKNADEIRAMNLDTIEVKYLKGVSEDGKKFALNYAEELIKGKSPEVSVSKNETKGITLSLYNKGYVSNTDPDELSEKDAIFSGQVLKIYKKNLAEFNALNEKRATGAQRDIIFDESLNEAYVKLTAKDRDLARKYTKLVIEKSRDTDNVIGKIKVPTLEKSPYSGFVKAHTYIDEHQKIVVVPTGERFKETVPGPDLSPMTRTKALNQFKEVFDEFIDGGLKEEHIPQVLKDMMALVVLGIDKTGNQKTNIILALSNHFSKPSGFLGIGGPKVFLHPDFSLTQVIAHKLGVEISPEGQVQD